MTLTSPPCYLGLLVLESDWVGPRGGPQMASLDGWTLRVEPRATGGWAWSLHEDDGAPEAIARGVVDAAETSEPEAEAKTRAADAWRFAQSDETRLSPS